MIAAGAQVTVEVVSGEGRLTTGAGIIWNDQLGCTLKVLEGRHMTVNPVPQVLAQRGPREGVSAGAQNGDEQRSRGDVTDAPVVDRDRVSTACRIMHTLWSASPSTTVGVLGLTARCRWCGE